MRLSCVRRSVVPNGSAGITPQKALPPSRACSSCVSSRVRLCIGEDRQHRPLEKTEAHSEGVVRKNELVGGDAPIAMHQHGLVAVFHLGDRRVLVQRDIGRKAVGETFDQCSGLNQDGARREKRLAVKRGADVLGQVLFLDHLVRLPELVQAAAVGIEDGNAPILDRCLVFADRTELAIDAVLFDQRPEVCSGPPS